MQDDEMVMRTVQHQARIGKGEPGEPSKYNAKSALVITKPCAVQELPQLIRSPSRNRNRIKSSKR